MNILLTFIASGLFFILTFIVDTLGAKLIFLFIAFLLFKWGSHQIQLIENGKEEEIKKETEKLLQEFIHSQSTISDDYLNALLLDEASQTLFIATRENLETGFDVKEFLFNEIYESSIEEDGKQIALISRGGLLGGTLLDDGGNSLVYIMEPENNKKNDTEETEDISKDTVSKLSLKLVVDDLASPIIEYVFLESEEKIDKDSDEYKDAAKECKKWHQMISVLIKRHDLLNKVIIKRYEDTNNVI
ncbi:hypothetical protein [Rummeliibacillus sp. POC4]|uniref:hypothetical protein n=1 Tax=Rummeliibacillus sp. POC4 TaxID=2305899 RepID=UPI000E673956|nr:hypothetical protein [Rummeliibacillus sp. POC4]RIJ63142.1 hypothetical protein D1606_16425 [Rummeliibacillus sp. POC4]